MKDKRTTVLIALLAVLAGILVITRLTSSGPVKNAQAPVRAADKKTARAGMPKEGVKVDLDLLGKPKENYLASKNIFNPVYEKPSLQRRGGNARGRGPGNKVTVTPLKALPPPPPPKTQAEIDMDNAREEMKKLKVLGFLKRKGRMDVFLSLGSENYVVAKGDNITKQYYLTDVAKDSVTVSDRKTGIAVKLNTDFSRDASSKIVPSPGFGGAGAGGGPQRYPNPFVGRQAGPPGGNFARPGNVPGPQGMAQQGGMARPGNAPGPQGMVQPGNAQRSWPDPLNNFSTR
jgi:hypothetical protein